MRKLGSFSKEELIKIFKDYPIIYPDNRYGRAKIVAKITMPTQNLIIPPITIWATSGQIDNGEFWVYGLI